MHVHDRHDVAARPIHLGMDEDFLWRTALVALIPLTASAGEVENRIHDQAGQ